MPNEFKTLQKFEDPTLALDPRTFGQVQAAILAQPAGATHLANAQQAQRTAFTTLSNSPRTESPAVSTTRPSNCSTRSFTCR